ncbi:lysoplasmalogenase [Agromyces archimandritae]|uniref:Lysoplasmalogenase n=1 Tax=Agromyces archimandritae TaxID=2781962 RepID=A0A975INZ4_9MICO|nr:lysoplasmalogenase [Agromyces archimandritae]QTX05075.1 lysoplasmalogenase [Agromyces archimandritae]
MTAATRAAARPDRDPASTAAGAFAAFAPYLVISAVHLALLAAELGTAARISKLLLMPALALAVLLYLRGRRGGTGPAPLLLIAGIAFSWGGDAPLSVPGEGWFLVGLGSFLIAHLCYLALFARGGLGVRRPRVWALVYPLWLVALMAIMWPNLGGLVVPVLAYGIVLCAMAAVGSGLNASIAWGGAFFVASDSLLAIGRFVPAYEFGLHDEAVMATYLVAQGLIAWGAVRIMTRADAVAAPAPQAAAG